MDNSLDESEIEEVVDALKDIFEAVMEINGYSMDSHAEIDMWTSVESRIRHCVMKDD